MKAAIVRKAINKNITNKRLGNTNKLYQSRILKNNILLKHRSISKQKGNEYVNLNLIDK